MTSGLEVMPSNPNTTDSRRAPVFAPGTRLGGRGKASGRGWPDHSCLASLPAASYPADMTKPETTTSGGFERTQWTVVLGAKAKSAEALERLCQAYRAPLLSFLRRSGDSQEAEEQLQDFLATLLQRDFLKNVGPEKGRFRTFLIRSLQNYLRDQHRKDIAGKRDERMKESLDERDEEGHPRHEPAAPIDTPEVEFDKRWARTVLAGGQRRLREECAREGKGALLEAFQPALFLDPEAATCEALGARFGLEAGNVRVILHRLRKRLRHHLRAEILETVADEAQLEDEVRYLISLFGK